MVYLATSFDSSISGQMISISSRLTDGSLPRGTISKNHDATHKLEHFSQVYHWEFSLAHILA